MYTLHPIEHHGQDRGIRHEWSEGVGGHETHYTPQDYTPEMYTMPPIGQEGREGARTKESEGVRRKESIDGARRDESEGERTKVSPPSPWRAWCVSHPLNPSAFGGLEGRRGATKELPAPNGLEQTQTQTQTQTHTRHRDAHRRAEALPLMTPRSAGYVSLAGFAGNSSSPHTASRQPCITQAVFVSGRGWGGAESRDPRDSASLGNTSCVDDVGGSGGGGGEGMLVSQCHS